jgi:hypothetical protein
MRTISRKVVLRAENCFQAFAYNFVIDEIFTVGGGHAQVYSFDETPIVFDVMGENLLREFVGANAFCRRDLGKLCFLIGLKAHFHGVSLGRVGVVSNGRLGLSGEGELSRPLPGLVWTLRPGAPERA